MELTTRGHSHERPVRCGTGRRIRTGRCALTGPETLAPSRVRDGLAQRSATRRRIAVAARVALAAGEGVSPPLLADLCEQVGASVRGLRRLFPTDESLLDAVYELLVDECADRLRAGVAAFPAGTSAPAGSDESATRFFRAARALAEAWPLDRGGFIIRSERRLRALRELRDGGAVTEGERRFVLALSDAIGELLSKIGRDFAWPTTLAVRIIVDTWERSFEAWLLDGHRESEFAKSPYIARTLPTLLEQLSRDRQKRDSAVG